MENMLLTVVEVDDSTLWNGTQVRNIQTNAIKTVVVLPKDKTISECVKEGIFDPIKNIELETVLNNKTRFELVK